MRGLMMDAPLLVTSIIEHAARIHGTDRDRGAHARRWHPPHHLRRGAQPRQAAGQALAALGVRPGDRVGSLAWNTHHHFELFYGVSGIGAVLHTINPRLFDEQLAYIVNHAEDPGSASMPARCRSPSGSRRGCPA